MQICTYILNWRRFSLCICLSFYNSLLYKHKIAFFLMWIVLFHLGGDYMIPICQDETSTHPAGSYFTLQLNVEIKLRPGKTGQFSTLYLFTFACIFFDFFFFFFFFFFNFLWIIWKLKPIDFHWPKIFFLEPFTLQLCLFFFIK